ncbi:unnamed protein product [Euphydryas editha]|uniref:Reverse transcriptase n=1 Tax=Euphydryas editha TaxID=104508 RepID=A0AAU9UEE5_EUPED|nr:unnamed protein product [Euphydryas editha]
MLNPLQSDFHPEHNTTTALINITDDSKLVVDNHQIAALTLSDFSNDFSTVDFDVLLAVLYSLNMSSNVIDWFHTYLHGRWQRIRVQDYFSD